MNFLRIKKLDRLFKKKKNRKYTNPGVIWNKGVDILSEKYKL